MSLTDIRTAVTTAVAVVALTVGALAGAHAIGAKQDPSAPPPPCAAPFC